jgi:hypothetical protein
MRRSSLYSRFRRLRLSCPVPLLSNPLLHLFEFSARTNQPSFSRQFSLKFDSVSMIRNRYGVDHRWSRRHCPLLHQVRRTTLILDVSETLTVICHLAQESYEEQNKLFRNLGHLHTHTALLSELLSGLSYAHGKIPTAVLAVLARPFESTILKDLGEVYRFSMWETIVLKGEMSSSTGTDAGASASASKAGEESNSPEVVMSDVTPAEPVASSSSTPTRTSNLKSISDVIVSLPQYIIPLQQGKSIYLSLTAKITRR